MANLTTGRPHTTINGQTFLFKKIVITIAINKKDFSRFDKEFINYLKGKKDLS